MPVKVTNWFKRDKGIEYNDKIVLIMFIIYTILLFYLIILKIIIKIQRIKNIKIKKII